MTEPRTLLQMAGANLTPSRLREAAVVVIDAQNEYVDGKLALPAVKPALQVLAGLLHRARVQDTPVFHVVHKGRAGSGGAFDPETRGFQIADEAAPVGAEPVIEKGLPNSFAHTTLLEALKATGRRELILVGFMTHMCVSSTARAALDIGFRVTVAGDACATRDLPDPLGGAPLSAADIHRTALAELADRFAVVCRAAQIEA
ncbi:cysteine hydrolase [Alsobacter soli]|uniref:Cysteine hydrolase n=1 Tax=Alsobacter soli TaxID=2109933 RepID=A0A2T1HSQ7_9HYPH|nr:cysteine hydrolase family protein [Alsobacter soli]PSC04685.1 cysteine hydrolase [Alsobacter soli]